MTDDNQPATRALLGGGEPNVKTLSAEEYTRARKKLIADYERERWRATDAEELARITRKYTTKGV